MIRLPLLSLCVLFCLSCAAGRLEKLEQRARMLDREKMEKKIPQPVEVDSGFEVTHRVEIGTSMGTMVIALFGKDAPLTVASFLGYVKEGFYEDKIFHRVIPGFMIQGGGYTPDLEKAEVKEPIRLEIIPGLEHVAGTVSMARTSERNSATSQFFICVAEAKQLNGEYAAFGRLEEGFETVERISTVSTESMEAESSVLDDVPSNPVVIESASVL